MYAGAPQTDQEQAARRAKPVVLILGCPEVPEDVVPSGAIGLHFDELVEAPAVHPVVCVVGPRRPQPMLAVQQLIQSFPGTEVVIVSTPDAHQELERLVQGTPLVPLSTTVVTDVASLGDALERAYARSSLAMSHGAARRKEETATSRAQSSGLHRIRKQLEDEDEQQSLREFYELYRVQRNSILKAVCAEVADVPALAMSVEWFGRVIAPDAQAELEGLAVYEAKWQPLTEQLQKAGETLALLGVAHHAWTQLQLRTRRHILEHVLQEQALELVELRRALVGMETFCAFVQSAVSLGYYQTTDKRERARAQREALYQSVVESSGDAIASKTLHGIITSWNKGAEELYGYTPGEAVGQHVSLVVPERKRAELSGIMDEVLAGRPVSLDTVRVRKDGREVEVALTVSPTRDFYGEVRGASAITRDITERRRVFRELKRKKKALERARRSFEDLYENAPDIYFSVMLRDGTITQANATVEARLGYTPMEVVGRPLWDLFAPREHENVHQVLRELIEAGHTSNRRLRSVSKDGRSATMLLSASTGRDERGRNLYARCVLRDVSEEVALEARRAAMLDGALDGVITVDGRGDIVEFNPAAQRMFGYSADEVIGRSLADTILPEPYRESYRRGLQRYLETGEGVILAKRAELPALRSDGHQLMTEVSIVRLHGIEPPLFTGFVRDVSRLKEMQEELVETVNVLRRSNNDLEQFAYIASHDLQEPLRMILVYMGLFVHEYGNTLDEQAAKYVSFAMEGARRMKRLIDDLLAYSSLSTRRPRIGVCDLGRSVTEAIAVLKLNVEGAGAKLVVDHLPEVQADEEQMVQLFRNLISNATKFHAEHEVEIRILAERDEQAWVISVKDDGIGVEAEYAERIFNMFHRLHERSRFGGSGIGLAICKRIVTGHGGEIWVESAGGKGSTFRFKLPDQPCTDPV